MLLPIATLYLLMTVVHLPHTSLADASPHSGTNAATESVSEHTLRNRRGTDKKAREFVGKRSDSDLSGDLSEYSIGDLYPELESLSRLEQQNTGEIYEEDKRAREFVGKRFLSYNSLSPSNKRAREFVGKRSDDGLYLYPDEHNILELTKAKRPRQFVGKRSVNYDYLSSINKRAREFVGKRDDDGLYLYPHEHSIIELPKAKRPRQFVGKRFPHYDSLVPSNKRAREFVGKRDSDGMYLYPDGHNVLELSKRPREFVGKRSPNYDYLSSISKRVREFVGKRDGNDISLYPDEESAEVLLNTKRAREFVGKRSTNYDSLKSISKRVREFVGKRDGGEMSSDKGEDKNASHLVGTLSGLAESTR